MLGTKLLGTKLKNPRLMRSLSHVKMRHGICKHRQFHLHWMARYIEKHNHGLDDLICHPRSAINQSLCTGPQISSHSSLIRWGNNNHPHCDYLKLNLRKKKKKEPCVKWRKPCVNCGVFYKERKIVLVPYTGSCVTRQALCPGDAKWWLQRTSHTWNHHKCTARRLVASTGVARQKQVPLCHLVIVGPPALRGPVDPGKRCVKHTSNPSAATVVLTQRI